jgi:phage FluMu protein Com
MLMMKELACPNCGSTIKARNAAAYPLIKCRQCKEFLELVAVAEEDEAIITQARRKSLLFTWVIAGTLLTNLLVSYYDSFDYPWIPFVLLGIIIFALLWESVSRKKVFTLIMAEKAMMKIRAKK